MAPGEDLLGALGRLPRGRGRPRARLQGHRPRLEARGGRPRGGGPGPRARPALAVLVAQVRGRCRRRPAPPRTRLPPAAGLGHHEQARPDPARRTSSGPGHRQEPGGVPPQALPRPMSPRIPALLGVLGREDVRATARSIADVQEPDGAVPWTTGGHTEVWNHVEAAMALLVGGEPTAAHRAYDWCLATQRDDGSWPMRTVAGVVEDPSAETNMTAYLAVGVWHHWLVRHDEAFVRRCWPAVRPGLGFVVSPPLPLGGGAGGGGPARGGDPRPPPAGGPP